MACIERDPTVLLFIVLFTTAVLTSSQFSPLELFCISAAGRVRLPFYPPEVLSDIAIPEMYRRGRSVGGKGKLGVVQIVS